MREDIQVVAFDADDTLWVNEPYFRESEAIFCELLADYLPAHSIERELLKVEMANLSTLGYGTKAFIISMIETAIEVTDGTISGSDISKIINIGKSQLAKPVVLLDGVIEVLEQLQGRYRLVVATKGDLMEQQGKIDRSGLSKYFHHIEIVSEKTVAEYRRMIGHLDIEPRSFLMIGNSIKSDILPVLEAGGHAWHIPYHITWSMERVEGEVHHLRFRQYKNVLEVLSDLV